jgi:tetratricopeptide (TPR) repeat protein
VGLRICRRISRRDERSLEDVAMVLLGIGFAQQSRGRLIGAERTFRQIARLVRESTHPHLVGWALNGVGVARLARGELRGTRDIFLRALKLKERAGDLHQIAVGYSNLAEVELRLNEIPAALAHARRAVQLGEQVRAGSDLADMYRTLADASLASGELEAAIDTGLKALSIAEVRGRVYLGEVALALARAIARVAELSPCSTSLRDKAAEATAVLRASLSKHFSDRDGELRRRAEECNLLLSQAMIGL